MAFHDVNVDRNTFALEVVSADHEQSSLDGGYARLGKRALDLVLSLLLLPLLLPVMVAIWAVIRLDGSAALFAQPRVGLGGAVYKCFKFRTMVPHAERVLEEMCAADPKIAAEWTKYQKLSNDPRITKIGHILRKTSLDELPQIFNVLRGDMSLVGPRPFLPSQREVYDRIGGRAYYRLRPGVTGLWQIFSRHDTTFVTRVRFDEAYGARLSAVSDLSLIARTARVVLMRTGA